MDKKVLDSLSNFASALENLVEELKSQGDAEKERQKIFQGITGKRGIQMRLKRIEAGIKSIKDDTKQILRNQKTIMSLAKEKEGETSVFGKAGGNENVKKITSGVGTIILIAGAVLAIGTAFKIIGSVDFLSVVALALSITLLAETLSRVNKNGLPSPQDALVAGLSILAFTGGVVASSFLLTLMPSISLSQIITFGLIGGMFAIMSFGIKTLVEATKNIKPTSVLYLPLILPAISAGIVLSSFILAESQIVPYNKLFNILATGLTLSLVAIAMTIPLLIFGKLGGSMVKGALLSILILPAISLAIMISSHLIGLGDYSTELPLSWAISLALGVGIMAIPILILGAIPLPVVLLGSLSLLIIAGALVLASKILSYLDPMFLQNMADNIAYFIDVVGGALVRFAKSAMPVVREFLDIIVTSVLPILQVIIDYMKAVVNEISEIITAMGSILHEIGFIISKIAVVYESIGNVIIGILSGVKDIIVAVADSIVKVFNSITNSIMNLSQINGGNLAAVGAGLVALSGGLYALTAGELISGLGSLMSFFTGGESLPDRLMSLSEHHEELYKTGKGVKMLASGIDTLNNIDLDDEKFKKVLYALTKINDLSRQGASANIETISRQVLEGSNLMQGLEEVTSSGNKELLEEVRTMNTKLDIIAGFSGNISNTLNQMRQDKDNTDLKF